MEFSSEETEKLVGIEGRLDGLSIGKLEKKTCSSLYSLKVSTHSKMNNLKGETCFNYTVIKIIAQGASSCASKICVFV